MGRNRKKHALAFSYQSPNQFVLPGFETPFERELNPTNRWVVLSRLIPWDEICSLYLKQVGIASTVRPVLNPRVALGSLIIKYLCNLDDRETVSQISENIYMQYFLGYSSFSDEPPFDASLFVDLRKRIGLETIGLETLNAINERIVKIKTGIEKRGTQQEEEKDDSSDLGKDNDEDSSKEDPCNKGRVIFDATACPQDIAYPTDLELLSDAREKTEELIDRLYDSCLHEKKPRTYRKVVRKTYLQTAQKKNKTRKQIRKSLGQQLRFLRRNISSIHRLLDAYTVFPLKGKQLKYFYVVQTLYEQQREMYEKHSHTVDHRIVSIHQPHVRPIVRGKSQSKVEFGSKIHVSIRWYQFPG